MNKFAVLSTTEIEAATAQVHDTVGNDDAGTLVSPVPSDAPPPPTTHPSYGEPVTTWAYHDSEGVVSSLVCRFEAVGGRKQIIPLTLWRDGFGQLRWRWKGTPAPRPLYNLDKLTANPSAPVVILEGEKSADAARCIFPKSVVTTSPGGAQAAAKADWKPLAGRRVLIWPDADAPGSKYAAEVAATLTALGSEILIIDARALGSMTPDGSPRDLPKVGWDAADAIEEWRDLGALRRAATGLMKPFEPGPQFVSWGDFTMDADGLTVETKGRGRDPETVSEYISSAFEVLGATRDPSGHDWGKWLRWRDGDGREHVRHVAEAALQGDPASLAASLAAEGLRVSRTQQKALAQYLCGVTTKNRVTMVARTGWHNVGGHDVFVLPNETIGPRGSETVILDAIAAGPYETRGNLDDWKSGVGVLSSKHFLPTLAVSTALAGPLLYLAGQEGGGLNFFGPSSKGKTTLLQMASSVWGRGASPGFVRAWRATANGLEGAAASATDTALVLDELGVVEARDAAAAIYGLSNGTGKARANREGGLREPKSWRVFVLSSGEMPIETKLAEERGRRVRAGQLVRLLDIPADRALGFGAFDNAGPDGDAGKLSKAMKHAAISAYGTAGPEFVRQLISERVDGAKVRAMVAEFVASVVPQGSDGQIDRAAQRLGLVMAAGELATAMGVTPWEPAAARIAAAWAFEQWVAGRGGTEPAEVRQAIETVRLVIEQHAESRFEPIDGETAWRPVGSRLGWRKGDGGEREWWIPPETWRAEICGGLDPKFVAKALGERGMLVKAGDGWQSVKKIDGTNRRVFVVLSTIFDGANHGS